MTRRANWQGGAGGSFHILRDELARLLDDYLRSGGYTPAEAAAEDLEPAAWQPLVDVYDRPDALVILADIPGVDPQSLDLSVTGNTLSLKGTRPAENLAESQLQTRERRTGTFHRELVLSGEVDFDQAKAKVEQGVLTIQLPKRVAARPRTIPIHSA